MKIRQLLAIIFGTTIIYRAYKEIYESIFFEAFIWTLLIIIGATLLSISIFKDYKNYKQNKKLINFRSSFSIVGFTLITMAILIKTELNFDKPTLIDAYYADDIGGLYIDFKTDGSYIFASTAIGCSNYSYGTYKISGNRITLNKIPDGYITSCHLEIITNENGKESFMKEISGSNFTFTVKEDNR